MSQLLSKMFRSTSGQSFRVLSSECSGTVYKRPTNFVSKLNDQGRNASLIFFLGRKLVSYSCLLMKPVFNLNLFGQRGFLSFNCPELWNRLPADSKKASFIGTFNIAFIKRASKRS